MHHSVCRLPYHLAVIDWQILEGKDLTIICDLAATDLGCGVGEILLFFSVEPSHLVDESDHVLLANFLSHLRISTAEEENLILCQKPFDSLFKSLYFGGIHQVHLNDFATELKISLLLTLVFEFKAESCRSC